MSRPSERQGKRSIDAVQLKNAIGKKVAPNKRLDALTREELRRNDFERSDT